MNTSVYSPSISLDAVKLFYKSKSPVFDLATVGRLKLQNKDPPKHDFCAVACY